MGPANEENGYAQVTDDPYFSLVVVNPGLQSDDITICGKSTASGPSKHTDKLPVIRQIIPSAVTTHVPPPTGVTGFMIWSTAKAWDSSRHLTEFLESLKNVEVDREGTHFSFYYSNPLILLSNSWSSYPVALTTQLVTSQKALSKEKSTRSVVDQSLAEEKTARHVAEQALKSSNDAKAELAQELETTQASLTATCDKLIAKSTALDTQVIRNQ
jgi:hypothetical protein